MKFTRVALAVMVILTATVVQSRTWRVELDGSADFTNIQPAVVASANGDTVQIGAGRFNQTFLYQAPGWSDYVVVGINNKDITLIGSGHNVTIIGPAARDALLWPGPIGIMVDLDCDVRIESLTTENIRCGVYFWSDHLEMRNCTFRNHDIALMTWGTNGTIVTDCRYEVNDYGILGGGRGYGLSVADCEFVGLSSKHISLQDYENVVIDNCQFYNASSAVQFDGNSCEGTISNCVVHSGTGSHFVCVSHATMNIYNNELFGGLNHLAAVTGTISGSGNVLNGPIRDGTDCATIYGQMGTYNLRDNHIFRGAASYAVMLYDYVQPQLIELDFRNNWWDTTDPEILASWIYDEHDDPTLNVHTMYEPFQSGPVPNENMSFGEIKAMFRR